MFSRRSFLGRALSTIVTGPSIVKIFNLGLTEAASKVIGFPDLAMLPRLTLVQKTSRLHAENGVPVGKFAIVKPDLEYAEIGDHIRCTPIHISPTVIQFSPDYTLNYLNPDCADYNERLEIAMRPDAFDRGHAYGTNVYLILNDQLVVYPCISKSARRFAMVLHEQHGIGPNADKLFITATEMKIASKIHGLQGLSFAAPSIHGKLHEMDLALPWRSYNEVLHLRNNVS